MNSALDDGLWHPGWLIELAQRVFGESWLSKFAQHSESWFEVDAWPVSA